MPNAYMTKMANAKKQNLASFTHTSADKIERTYKRVKVGGLVTYKCVGENCKEKRKKSKKHQRKDLAKAAAKAARTRSKRMSAKKRAAAKAARDKKKHNVGIRQAARKRSARVKREKKAKAKDDREFEYYRKKAQKEINKNNRKRSRRASKKSKDCGIGERYVKGKGCVLREQSQFAGKFMTGFGGGKRKIRVGPRGGRYVLKGGKKVYL